MGEFAAGKDDRDVYNGAVELGFVHVCDCGFGVWGVAVDDVGGATVGHDYSCQFSNSGLGFNVLTLSVHGQIKLSNWTIHAKYFS